MVIRLRTLLQTHWRGMKEKGQFRNGDEGGSPDRNCELSVEGQWCVFWIRLIWPHPCLPVILHEAICRLWAGIKRV